MKKDPKEEQQEEPKRTKVLADPDVRRWHENLARGSRNTAEVGVRRLDLFCRQNKSSPKGLLALPKKSLENMVLDHVSSMEKHGRAPQYIEGVVKSVKSWLDYNEIKLTVKVRIKNSTATPTLVDEVVPTPEELKKILGYADERAKVAIVFPSNSGVRLEVLGNESGTDGLKIGDIPELVIKSKHASFKKVPALVIVRAELSKAGHRYFTFLTQEGCEYLIAYLDRRMATGEILQPSSPIIAVTPGFERKGKADRNIGSSFISTKNVSRMIRNAMRPNFKWRPYVLRSYFDSGMMVAENRGKIGHPYTVFFMGHKGDMSSKYSTHKGRLRDEDVEDMREAFKKCQEFLQTSKAETASQEAMVSAFNRQFLAMAGYSDDEISKMGDLSKLSPQEIQELISKKSMAKLGLSGKGRQKVVPPGEVKGFVLQGWDYAYTLPSGEAVIRLPGSGGEVGFLTEQTTSRIPEHVIEAS